MCDVGCLMLVRSREVLQTSCMPAGKQMGQHTLNLLYCALAIVITSGTHILLAAEDNKLKVYSMAPHAVTEHLYCEESNSTL